MTTWAIIPVKPLHDSKRRLAHLLSAAARADLIHSFLDELLAVLNETPGIDHVLVVSGDRSVLALAEKYGAAVLIEGEPLGLNAAVSHGATHAADQGATAVLFLPAFGFLLLMESRGVGAFGHTGLPVTLLLIGAGIVTSIPLLLFAAGARRIPLTTLGLLQYIAPTMQFLIGVLVYNETFGLTRLIGFGLVWLALVLYTIETLIVNRRRAVLPAGV